MIETRHLTFSYDDDPVLRDITLEFADDEFVLITGQNGSGKTTLVRHFNALLRPDTGTVLVNGRPTTADLAMTRSTVGLVFQDPRDGFVATTVAADVAFAPENLGLPRDEIDRRVANALEVVDMHDRHDERIDGLSGGEQLRVAIAGVLAMEPDHLVLDESLTGLDYPSHQSIVKHLKHLNAAGRTGVIVVTHDLREVGSLADRIVVLDDGQVVANGPLGVIHDDLAAHGVRPPC